MNTFSSIYNPNSFVFVCLTVVEVASSNKQDLQVNNQDQNQNFDSGTESKFSLVSALADLWAHFKQPVDGLPQKSHVVVRRNVLKYGDLLREALGMEAKSEISREHKYLNFLK